MFRDPNSPTNKQKYCVRRPDGHGGSKMVCVTCSVDEELKVIRHYTFCAKAADCPTKYTDKPIWNVTSRLCEPCDPVEGCIDTGSVRFHFPKPLKKLHCGPRGVEVPGERTCSCPKGWITDFSQNPANWTWCDTRDWNHPYNVRRRAFEKQDRSYTLVIFASAVGVVLSCCFVLCFLTLIRNTCRQISRANRQRKSSKHYVEQHVP